MIHVGFTGTRIGMTHLQRAALRLLVMGIYRDAGTTFHHGDCVGADAEFHAIAREFGGFVVGHIPTSNQYRAFCDFDEVRAPLPYMERNSEIVTASDVVFAAPAEMDEQLRGGTWSTIRMAMRAGKELVLVMPNGAARETKATVR